MNPKKIIIVCLMMFAILLSGCGKAIHSLDDIICETESYDAIGKITIIDTYRLADETYYTLHFRLLRDGRIVYESPNFDLSEDEYNKYFGAGNDAFTTTAYELYCRGTVLEYKPAYLIPNDLGSNTYTMPYDKYIDNRSWSQDDAFIRVDDETDKILDKIFLYPHPLPYKALGRIHEYRFSVFGEKNFTESEIEDVKENMILMGNEFINTHIE